MVGKEVEVDQKWLARRDGEIFRVHYLMAGDLGEKPARELRDRYHFHLELQNILSTLNAHHSRVQAWLNYLSQQRQLEAGVFQEALKVFRDAHGSLELQLKAAGKLRIPELKNVTPGQALGSFLLSHPLIYALSGGEQNLSGEWINRFLGQFGEVRDKVRRIHYKSLGGILALQEKIAADWLARQAIAAEMLAPETGNAMAVSRQ
jgi:hypothetical protein